MTLHEIAAIHDHPKYKSFDDEPNQAGEDYDFSILELVQPIEMKPEARAIFLPTPDDANLASDAKFVVSGWGSLEWYGTKPIYLNAVTVPLVSDEDCRKSYAQPKDDGLSINGIKQLGHLSLLIANFVTYNTEGPKLPVLLVPNSQRVLPCTALNNWA